MKRWLPSSHPPTSQWAYASADASRGTRLGFVQHVADQWYWEVARPLASDWWPPLEPGPVNGSAPTEEQAKQALLACLGGDRDSTRSADDPALGARPAGGR